MATPTRSYGRERGISKTQLPDLPPNDEQFISSMVEDCFDTGKDLNTVINAAARYFAKQSNHFGKFRSMLNEHPMAKGNPAAAQIINQLREKMLENNKST